MKSNLEELRKRSVYLGTSSWKYPGWKGLVYRRSYSNEKNFKEESLKEYSEQYSTVGVDHTYYAYPTLNQMQNYFSQTPSTFKFVLKATETATVFQFPNLPRYGKNAGKMNPDFLNSGLFLEKFLEPLKGLENKLGSIVLEFSRFRVGTFHRGSDFLNKLDYFLGEVRKHSHAPLAVELRNHNWLVPEYFEVLTKHHTAHVFNSWTQMPTLADQWDRASSHPLPFYVARLLLKPGRAYQEAVDKYAPYDRIHEELLETRRAAVRMIESSLKLNKPAYLLVNNRFEGCAPQTIEGILKLFSSSDPRAD